MAKEISIVKYCDKYKEKWDDFINTESVNGTFLQSRKFLEYHPIGRFIDNSLLFLCGSNIVAVIPAHVKCCERKAFCSHQGSTFGGLILGKKFCKIAYLDLIFEQLNKYLKENQFEEIILKQTSQIYQRSNSELIDYYLFMNGFECSQELGYYINFKNYQDEIAENFTASKRRDYRYSLKNDFEFKELCTEEEIRNFYSVLCDNYKKFDKVPVHTIDELIEFKKSRLMGTVFFYGVFFENEIIAGGMVFSFENKVFHTQYLAVAQEKKSIFANEYLYTKLIETAKEKGYERISFGTSTLEGGKVLNRSLAQFKEGFGTNEYINRTYRKVTIV